MFQTLQRLRQPCRLILPLLDECARLCDEQRRRLCPTQRLERTRGRAQLVVQNPPRRRNIASHRDRLRLLLHRSHRRVDILLHPLKEACAHHVVDEINPAQLHEHPRGILIFTVVHEALNAVRQLPNNAAQARLVLGDEHGAENAVCVGDRRKLLDAVDYVGASEPSSVTLAARVEHEDAVGQAADELRSARGQPLRPEEPVRDRLSAEFLVLTLPLHLGGRLADPDENAPAVRHEPAAPPEHVLEDIAKLPDTTSTVSEQRLVVDEDDDAYARGGGDGLLDVHSVRHVDLEAAVVEEAGTVGVCETRAEAARGLYLGRERHAFFRVADLHQLVRPRARLDANHLVLRANAASTNKARLLLRDALQPAALNHVDER
mmetsp:Transcript_47510/g.154242  ORF Transcript_47510/g.154242 Transcript_47510/m.154242 type:complete len:376 (+) Transcript_47510:399-1526(+)